MKLVVLSILAAVSVTCLGSVLRAHEDGTLCSEIEAREISLGGLATSPDSVGTFGFKFASATSTAGVLYQCENGKVSLSHQFYVTESIEAAYELFGSKVTELGERFGPPCKDTRDEIGLENLMRASTEGLDLTGVVVAHWKPKSFGNSDQVSVEIYPENSGNRLVKWTVIVARGPSFVVAKTPEETKKMAVNPCS